MEPKLFITAAIGGNPEEIRHFSNDFNLSNLRCTDSTIRKFNCLQINDLLGVYTIQLESHLWSNQIQQIWDMACNGASDLKLDYIFFEQKTSGQISRCKRSIFKTEETEMFFKYFENHTEKNLTNNDKPIDMLDFCYPVVIAAIGGEPFKINCFPKSVKLSDASRIEDTRDFFRYLIIDDKFALYATQLSFNLWDSSEKSQKIWARLRDYAIALKFDYIFFHLDKNYQISQLEKNDFTTLSSAIFFNYFGISR